MIKLVFALALIFAIAVGVVLLTAPEHHTIARSQPT
jgi:hypothetical protein